MRTTSEILEHTGEVELRLRGPSLAAIAAEAGRALGRLELGRARPAAQGEWRTIVVQASDRDALLVEWLNELLFRAETERWVPLEFAVETMTDTRLSARVRGVPVGVAPSRVKAATFHGLRVTGIPGGFEATVVFDV